MLPTSGYFRDIVCPFLKSGLCERTHCHYRHDHKYEVKASTSRSSSTEAVPDYVPTPVSQLKTTITQPFGEKSATNVDIKPKTKTQFQNIYQNIPEYKPTPISELKRHQIGSYSSDETTDQKPKHKKSNEEISNGKQKKTNDKTKDKTKDKLKDKNVIQTITKSETKTKRSISKSSDDSEQSPTKVGTKEKRKSSEEGKSSDFDSYDFNEELFQSLNEISSRKKSFDDIITTIDESYETVSKKVRIAHQNPHQNPSNLIPKKLEKKTLKPTPSQVMQQRFAIQANKADTNESKVETTPSSNSSKLRIAHKPNNISVESKSETQSLGNNIIGKKRIAHKPIASKRPVLVGAVGNKLSLKLRQLYLNKFIDEYLVFSTEEEAFKRGLESEKSVYDRSKTENIYKVLSVHEVKKIRTEFTNKQNNSPSKTLSAEDMKKFGNPVVSHEAILNGKISGTFSVERRQKAITVEDLTDIELYKMLLKYVMSDKLLKDYGYPRPHPSKRGSALLPALESQKKRNNYESRIRNCSRCQKTYTVDDNEMPNLREVCIYHFGRLWNERFNKSIEKKYSCCKNDIGSGGCSSNAYHIFDGYDRPDYCDGYVRTLPLKPPPTTGYFGIYGLDCEMCYTTHGLELTRVTVVNVKQQTIYETMVKPSHPILDYNSKFSGIKESDLRKVTTTISDVQKRLQTLFNENTILIGHSLESDLKALKLIHNTVIDTAQVFPHKRGLPYKRALRTLTAEFLKKIIQDDVEGHDSKEDATAALKLMLWKINEDLKKFKR